MSESRLAQSIAAKVTAAGVPAAGAPGGAEAVLPPGAATGAPAPPAQPAPAQAEQSPIEKLLGFLTTYIPTALVSLYVALWSAVVASERPDGASEPTDLGDTVKFAIAAAMGVLSLLFVWGQGHYRARQTARARRRISPVDTFVAGRYEIIAAGIAAFAWATAVPSSWAAGFDWFNNPVMPLVVTIGVSIALQIGAMFFGKLES